MLWYLMYPISSFGQQKPDFQSLQFLPNVECLHGGVFSRQITDAMPHGFNLRASSRESQ